MKKTILIFGSIAAASFILFELNKLSLLGIAESDNLLILFSGLAFITIGIVISKLLTEKVKRQKKLKRSSLSNQEHKVLVLMNDGLSNHEIAEHLFISESTVKTHVSNILSKLNARRRTEAIKIGRELDII